MTDWLTGTIIERRQWTDDLFSLRFEAPLAEFKAGQFVRIALDIDGERVGRPYSLVNAPHEPFLEIYFNIVKGGPLSPRLAALEPGATLWLSNTANGFMILDEIPEARYLWLLATGTGIGPFLSILKVNCTASPPGGPLPSALLKWAARNSNCSSPLRANRRLRNLWTKPVRDSTISAF